jgi:anti-sigma factor RsiW
LTTALAMAAVILVIVLQPYFGQIKSFDQIGAFALAEHLSSDLEMTFKAQEVGDATGWFSERLGFQIAIPGLEEQGFQFVGGRECFLGKKKAAYLYYQKQGEKVSLFIINYRDLDFPLSRHKTYMVYDQGYEIKVWIRGKLCYALVE